MRTKIRLSLLALLFTCFENALAANSPLDQIAVVNDIADFPVDPCTTEFKGLSDGDDWPIKVNSKFKIEKRSGSNLKHHIDVDSDPSNVMGTPDLYVINGDKSALGKNYCAQGGDVKSHLYVFGIHDIENPADHKKSLHAFIYVPMRLSALTPGSLADEFYLFVFTIKTDSKQCKGVDRQRCLALRRLVVTQADETEEDFIEAVGKEMKNILPKKPPTAPRFHNGVIHGSL
jgi:hypothetical protein